METKKQESRSDQPVSFFYERKGTEKDAVALIPVLRGAIRLHNSSVLSLMHPLIRLHTPETDIRSQSWKLHVAGPLAKVHGAMRLCKIPFFHTMSPPTNYMLKYNVENAKCSNGDKALPMSFPVVLKQINDIEATLIDSLAHQKNTIVDNAVEIRKQALLELVVHMSIAADNEKVTSLQDQLYVKMQAAWNKSTKQLMQLPFKHKYAHRGMEDWSGMKNFDSFCAGMLDADKRKENFDAFTAEAKLQESKKFDTIVASMKLSNDMYVKLTDALQGRNFVPEMMTELINNQILKNTEITSDTLSNSSIEKWEEYVGQYFSDLLSERCEVFQSHVYTYFSVLLGRGKSALKKSAQLTEKVIDAACGAFFESNVDIYIAQGESAQAAAHRLNVAKCRNQFIIAKRNLPLDLVAFFAQAKIKPLSDDDKGVFRERVKAMFAGLPDQSKFVRNGELYDTSIPSVIAQVDAIWTRTMAWSMEELSIGKGALAVKLRHKAHKGSEFIQEFINTKLGGSKAFNIPFAVTAAIIHANGVSENAFAAVLCTNTTTSTPALAASYLKKHNFPMQDGKGNGTTSISELLNEPDWLATPTVTTLKTAGTYLGALSLLFAVEITVQPALTKKQGGGKASSKRRSKKGGGKEQQQKKKPAPQKAKQPQNAKGNQPKKEPAQKKKGEPAAKGKKGKK